MGVIEGATMLLKAGAPVNGTDEVQTITPSAAVASGAFRLSYEGCITSSLAFNVSAANMQAALRALPTIGSTGCTVGLNAGVYTVTFAGTLAKKALPLITVPDAYNTVKDAGAAAITWTVAEGTPGVTADGLGAPKGGILIDVTNGNAYVNRGTPTAPTWTSMPFAFGAGYKVARGVHDTVAAVDTLATGLATVVAAVVTLASNPTMDPITVTADVGDQAGAPAAGSIYIKSWKPTAANNCELIAATTFAKKVNWVAIGT